jgi:hypothetical protein
MTRSKSLSFVRGNIGQAAGGKWTCPHTKPPYRNEMDLAHCTSGQHLDRVMLSFCSRQDNVARDQPDRMASDNLDNVSRLIRWRKNFKSHRYYLAIVLDRAVQIAPLGR